MGRAWERWQAAQLRQPEPFSPTAREAERYTASMAPDRRMLGSGQNRTQARATVCPAKAWGNHPDAGIRALAEAQAREQHAFNDYLVHGTVHVGRCPAKACRSKVRLPISMFAKNDHTMRIALGMKRAARIKERGW